MSRDKQIEGMAKDIACKIAWDEDEIPTVNCLETAKRLYCEGYRKASDVAEEIFAEIEHLMHRYCNEPYYTSGEMAYDIAELKKKYIGKDTNVTTNTEEGK